MGVSKNRGGFTPQIIHLFIGFSINYKPSIFGGPPVFLVQHPNIELLNDRSKRSYRMRFVHIH